ncbi:MAG: hypothetical protein WC661_21365 [Opitutaceae bacterium]|jgi:hypothetical protein
MPSPRRKTISKTVQDAIVAYIGTLEDYAGVPVIGRRKGVITNDIEAELATLGACLYVFPALPKKINKNLPGPYVEKLQVRIRVIEAPSINSTLPDAYELAEMILVDLTELNLSAVEGLAGINPLEPLDTPIEEVPDDERVLFDITFETSVGLPAAA